MRQRLHDHDPAGHTTFLKFAHPASFGNKDVAFATNTPLLAVGNQTCTSLGSQILFGQVVQVYVSRRPRHRQPGGSLRP
jgi:hypothetical protein